MKQLPNSIQDAGSLAKINLHMKLFFKPYSASPRVAQVFRGVAAGLHFQPNCSALERSMNFHDALTVGMIEALRDPQNSRKPSQQGLISVVQRGISRILTRGLRLAIVIAH